LKPIELLVVDNNPQDVWLIRHALAREPYPVNIRIASDGREACELFADIRRRPDLVILDVNLPNLSALPVLECAGPYVPVVIFTSSFDSPAGRAAVELGVMEYVEKPSDQTEYITRVSQIMQHWAAPVPELQ
jgi:DNA-binding NtrC family response regulator